MFERVLNALSRKKQNTKRSYRRHFNVAKLKTCLEFDKGKCSRVALIKQGRKVLAKRLCYKKVT